MSWWKNRSHFSEQSGDRQYSRSTDEYEGSGQHEEGGGKKRSPSRPKRSGGKKADDEYPSYTANTNRDGDDDDDGGYNSHNGSYSSGGYNGYGGSPYNNGNSSNTPYYGGGGGYNNNSSYGNGGDGYTGGAHIPYNAPTAPWAPHDPAARTPMFINTREVHVYGLPGSQNESDYNNDRGRRGGGFFGPAFEAVGHFVDRRLGFNDRN